MKYALVDYRINIVEKSSLESLGCKVLICPPYEKLYESVCGHPDMLVHLIDNKNILVHRDMPFHFVELLKSLNFNVLKSHSSILAKYPYDITLNALSLSNLFVHYLKYTDRTLLNKAKNKILVNVKQGYTKCSTAIVSERAIMTSDKGIANSLKSNDIDVLLLPPGDIELPGLDYGFIGGCCGKIDANTLAFYGDLSYYAYGKEVLSFLKKHEIQPVYLRNGRLIDRGSIIVPPTWVAL
ncbi:DUF6873 family GME fold protein [Clostridium peptidivorans]|uniref:DUF6873 family GME fold protein n=1 Tax=Clostridium peptidivorans TaxID=100174 RepID=UPI000BE30449|nr:hypothetical protein [Clostridium peptidivorans]